MTRPAAPMPRHEAAALLGVPIDASPAEVQHAFMRAARRAHPDVLPESDEAGRRAAGETFAGLTRARDALLAPAPEPLVRPTPTAPPVPRAPGRALGGSLVLLALLAFLLIGIVSAEQGLRVGPYVVVPGSPSPSATP